MGVIQPSINAGTHTFESNISQTNDGTPQVYFEDRTDNHNKTIVSVRNTTATVPETPMMVAITTRDGVTVTEPVPQNRFIAFQMEDVVAVAIIGVGDGTVLMTGEISIQKTFCINCTL
jgi:hypothetical protein